MAPRRRMWQMLSWRDGDRSWGSFRDGQRRRRVNWRSPYWTNRRGARRRDESTLSAITKADGGPANAADDKTTAADKLP